MTDPASQEPVPDGRYLSLVRALGAITHEGCHSGCSPALHRTEAAICINAFLTNPELIWHLQQVAATLLGMRESLTSATESLRSLGESLASSSDGTGEETSSDG